MAYDQEFAGSPKTCSLPDQTAGCGTEPECLISAAEYRHNSLLVAASLDLLSNSLGDLAALRETSRLSGYFLVTHISSTALWQQDSQHRTGRMIERGQTLPSLLPSRSKLVHMHQISLMA
jgi:hypothetical protein